MITLDKFQGHIVLYCKGHYNLSSVDFIDGLRRIWAVRCGLQFEHISPSFDEYIADEMMRIIIETKPLKSTRMWEILHKGLVDEWRYKEMSAIHRCIMIYYNELMSIQVKDTSGDKYKTLVKLPKPQKQLFKRIVRGNFKYNDYNKVK